MLASTLIFTDEQLNIIKTFYDSGFCSRGKIASAIVEVMEHSSDANVAKQLRSIAAKLATISDVVFEDIFKS